MHKNLEIKTYEFNGYDVTIKMDYQNYTLSIVDPLDGYKRKCYVFAERPLDFMDNWVNILDAIKQSVEAAQAEMTEYRKAKQKENEDTAGEILDLAYHMVKDRIGAKDKKAKKNPFKF